jgi:hypothetical protein
LDHRILTLPSGGVYEPAKFMEWLFLCPEGKMKRPTAGGNFALNVRLCDFKGCRTV